MAFCELFVFQGVLESHLAVFTLFDGASTNGRCNHGGRRYWGGRGGRRWPRPVVCCLWRSCKEFAMAFCELFVFQGVLESHLAFFTLFDGASTYGRRNHDGRCYWGGRGGRWWPRPVVCCLWRS